MSALFRPLPWLVARTPALPIDAYLALPDDLDLEPADPRVRRALAVGGGYLLNALDSAPADPKRRRRLAGKLRRYLTRMSTRPTPYGLFAGVGLGRFAAQTDLALDASPPRPRTRPDMGWLLDLVADLERRPEVRSRLSWFANPTAVVRAGRLFLAERSTVGEDGTVRSVSVRATPAVLDLLAAARTPVPYGKLAADLLARPGATPEAVERMLAHLWEQTVLLSDLRPPLTAPDPARYVVERLAPIAPALAAALDELLGQLAEWDLLDAAAGAAGYPKLEARARELHSSEATPFQSDLAMPFAGVELTQAVADEAARAAELLLRLSPQPEGSPRLDHYRNLFVGRFGLERMVPLVELLDPELGLGPPEDQPRQPTERERERSRTLLELAGNALRDHRFAVDLDEATLARLETWPVWTASAPASLDLSVFVATSSRAALDAGDFSVVVGPNLGGLAAGRTLGRFADLLGPGASEALSSAAVAEEATAPGQVWAEVSYQPRDLRICNVAIRPLVREYELVVNATPSAPGDRVIPVNELMVGIREDRFVLHWPSRGVEVVPTTGHMLNPESAPPLVRFLADVAGHLRPRLATFDWGSARDLPFLPRVQVGRIVLAVARWFLSAADVAAFDAWRERWQPPRWVYLAVGDNRLLLDLSSPAQVALLREEAARSGRRLELQEALPAPDQAWLPGPDGSHVAEFVVPLVRTGPPAAVPAPLPAAVGRERLRPPGSDWLFATIYHVPTLEEDLITGALSAFGSEACAEGLADNWFFMRYVDPYPHLRLRLHGEPSVLTDKLGPELMRWASSLVASGAVRRVAIDTYDQEVERYGGPEALAAAERLFGADSVAVADLLRLYQSGRLLLDRPLLCALTVDDLLAGLGLDVAERTSMYRTRVLDRSLTGEAYRRDKNVLRSLIGDPSSAGAEVTAILDARRPVVESVARVHESLAWKGKLGRSRFDIAASIVHLHCNRLLGLGHEVEQRVHGLLLRTRESLSARAVR